MAPICKLQPCSVLRRSAWFQPAGAGAVPTPIARRATRPQAGADDRPSSTADVENKEASLERLEASIRGKTTPRPAAPGSPINKPKPIPIRGVSQPQSKIDSQYENMAEWREGQLFPEGWESMPLGQKVTELYLGRRGVLFWANKAAYASVFVLLGGWILFRFIGPALGLYKLAGDFAPPPL